MTTMRPRAVMTRAAVITTRTLHVVDVENLVGSGRPALGDVTTLRSQYLDLVGMAPQDQTVVACNPGCLVEVGVGWGPHCARYRVGAGHNGADWELLDVLECEHVADRFSRVVIASGDGIFAPMAARLAAAGCQVTVASRRASLSARLKLAAQRVIYLPTPEIAASDVPSAVGRIA